MEKSAKLIHGEEESAHYVHDHEKRPTTQSTLGMSTGQSNSSFKLLCLCRTTTLYIQAKNTTHQYQYFLANKQNTEAKIDDFPWSVYISICQDSQRYITKSACNQCSKMLIMKWITFTTQTDTDSKISQMLTVRVDDVRYLREMRVNRANRLPTYLHSVSCRFDPTL